MWIAEVVVLGVLLHGSGSGMVTENRVGLRHIGIKNEYTCLITLNNSRKILLSAMQNRRKNRPLLRNIRIRIVKEVCSQERGS